MMVKVKVFFCQSKDVFSFSSVTGTISLSFRVPVVVVANNKKFK